MRKNKKSFYISRINNCYNHLVILATIAFISYNGYTTDSRDASRLTTVKNIKDGLERYYVQTGDYPTPDDIYLTGQINGNNVNYVGYIGDEVSRAIKMNPVPLDPLTGNRYIYSRTTDKKKFQIALLQEKKKRAKVDGNYNGLLKFGDKIYNLPSLVFTGNTDLFSGTGTYFITEDSKNLPYDIKLEVVTELETTPEVLKRITGKDNITLTGITLSGVTVETFSGSVFETALGYNQDKIGVEILGNKYIASNLDTTSTGTTTNTGTTNTGTTSTGTTNTGTISSCNVASSIPNDSYFDFTGSTIIGYTSPYPSTITVRVDNTQYYDYDDDGNIDDTVVSYDEHEETNPDYIRDISIPCKINSVDVTHIGNNSFEYLELESVELPNTLTSIGNNSFYGNGIEYLTIPSNVTNIGSQAFYNNNLIQITIKSNDTNIGTEAFGDRWTLTGTGHAGIYNYIINSYIWVKQ